MPFGFEESGEKRSGEYRKAMQMLEMTDNAYEVCRQKISKLCSCTDHAATVGLINERDKSHDFCTQETSMKWICTSFSSNGEQKGSSNDEQKEILRKFITW